MFHGHRLNVTVLLLLLVIQSYCQDILSVSRDRTRARVERHLKGKSVPVGPSAQTSSVTNDEPKQVHFHREHQRRNANLKSSLVTHKLHHNNLREKHAPRSALNSSLSTFRKSHDNFLFRSENEAGVNSHSNAKDESFATQQNLLKNIDLSSNSDEVYSPVENIKSNYHKPVQKQHPNMKNKVINHRQYLPKPSDPDIEQLQFNGKDFNLRNLREALGEPLEHPQIPHCSLHEYEQEKMELVSKQNEVSDEFNSQKYYEKLSSGKERNGEMFTEDRMINETPYSPLYKLLDRLKRGKAVGKQSKTLGPKIKRFEGKPPMFSSSHFTQTSEEENLQNKCKKRKKKSSSIVFHKNQQCTPSNVTSVRKTLSKGNLFLKNVHHRRDSEESKTAQSFNQIIRKMFEHTTEHLSATLSPDSSNQPPNSNLQLNEAKFLETYIMDVMKHFYNNRKVHNKSIGNTKSKNIFVTELLKEIASPSQNSNFSLTQKTNIS